MNYFLLFFSIINKLFSCEDKVYTFYFLLFSFFENTKYFNTHTQGERGEGFKETNSDVYLKRLNSWIHSTCFKPL